MHKTTAFRVRQLAVLLGAAFVSAGARAEGPLSLTVSQTFEHDSNILRLSENEEADTVSSTGIQLGVDKPYGRQTYKGSILWARNAYSKHEDLSNNSYKGSGSISSEIGSNLSLALSGSAVRQLTNFNDQVDRVKDIVKNENIRLGLKYGLYGRMSLNGGLVASAADHSASAKKGENKKSTGYNLGVSYSPSEPLNFSLTYEDAKIKYEDRANEEKVDRKSLSAGAYWQVTGLSQLNAALGFARERYDYESRLNYSGLTGSLGWNYSPAGKLSYSLKWVRDTNNQQQESIFFTSERRLENTFTGTVRWEATTKVNFTATYNYVRYREDGTQIYDPQTLLLSLRNGSRHSNYNGLTLGAEYSALRYLAFGCDVSYYKKTEGAIYPGFSGNSVSCTANFVIDSLP